LRLSLSGDLRAGGVSAARFTHTLFAVRMRCAFFCLAMLSGYKNMNKNKVQAYIVEMDSTFLLIRFFITSRLHKKTVIKN